MTDGQGVPLAVSVAAADQAETLLVQRLHGHLPWWLRLLRPVLLADRAYDSDSLREYFAGRGWILVSPHRRGRRRISNDGRRMRRYRRRWIIERTIGWLHHFRRIVTRWEFYADLFQGFVQLACAILSLRRL